MQEGMFSLWQMAKTADAVEEFSRNGGLYISVLTHPTTGGVTASFATLGDITLAEPGALIGFAGPRVIEQTIGKKLPKGFQRAEYLYQHGFVDAIVPRDELKKTLTKLLMLHGYKVTGGTPW
jgi:acetyl-CoA carboxylase carboxyl transferase subunit beta